MIASTLTLRVRPRAGRNSIRGRRPDGALDVWVKAPPEGGRANAEVVALLAKELGVPRGAIEIVTGGTSRTKTVRIHGVAATELAARLAARGIDAGEG